MKKKKYKEKSYIFLLFIDIVFVFDRLRYVSSRFFFSNRLFINAFEIALNETEGYIKMI